MSRRQNASRSGVTSESTSAHIFAAEYFAEEVRREIYDRYGEKKLYEGGLSVRTSLDTKLQVLARKTFTEGLVRFDEAQGWRGPVSKIDIERRLGRQACRSEGFVRRRTVAAWPWCSRSAISRPASACSRDASPAAAVSNERAVGILPLDGMKWAKTRARRSTKVSQVVNPGDVVYVEPAKTDGQFRLHQIPEVSGAMVVEDPWTGRVLAMVGGFSFDQSQFNRATQALRQPGSSFKPFVYAAALDNGYTPSTHGARCADGNRSRSGRRRLASRKTTKASSTVPSTLRFGIEHSRNVMTVRLAQDIGMPLIAEYAKRFGVYDDLPPYLSFALGAGETTLLRMVTAYSMFDNGGRRVKPTLIDRIQDRYGHTVYKHDERECVSCAAKKWENQPEPSLVDRRAAGARSDDRLSDHLDDGRRCPTRHSDRGA